jgi:hypothetical protein
MIDGRDSTRDQELVGRLVRLAGPDTDVPAGGADEVRDAVRPVWRRELRARARRRRLAVALPLAAALVVALAAGLSLRNRRGGAGHRDRRSIGPTRLVWWSAGELTAGSRLRTGTTAGSVSVSLAATRFGSTVQRRSASPPRCRWSSRAGPCTWTRAASREQRSSCELPWPKCASSAPGSRCGIREMPWWFAWWGRVVVAARGREQQVSGVALALVPSGTRRGRIAIQGRWSWMRSRRPSTSKVNGQGVPVGSDETGLQVMAWTEAWPPRRFSGRWVTSFGEALRSSWQAAD